jgi:Uma2 family endonuclease
MAMISVERQRFTVDDYHRMAEAGILGPDDRVELIDGEVIRTSQMGSRHAACIGRLNTFLTEAVQRTAIVTIQTPLRIDRFHEPESDIPVLRRRTDFYDSQIPGPADVLFLMEISETSIGFDQATKFPAYAAGGVPEAWIVDLNAERIERHTRPSEKGFRVMSWAEAIRYRRRCCAGPRLRRRRDTRSSQRVRRERN